MRVLIALVERLEVPKGQEEIKSQLAFFFSFKILCCHDDTWFHLNFVSNLELTNAFFSWKRLP